MSSKKSRTQVRKALKKARKAIEKARDAAERLGGGALTETKRIGDEIGALLQRTSLRGTNGETDEYAVTTAAAPEGKTTEHLESAAQETVRQSTNEKERGAIPPAADAQDTDATAEFADLTVAELRALARSRGLHGYSTLRKSELIQLLSA